VGVWTRFSRLKIGTDGEVCCECGDEPLGSGIMECVSYASVFTVISIFTLQPSMHCVVTGIPS
jgi:hypothetical protein